MIDYIIGKVKFIGLDYIVVEANGIGYRIYTSKYSISQFMIGEEYLIHVEMVVREDAILLYGFYEEEELRMFNLLTSVTTIGPKSGLAILSTLSTSQIVSSIATNDIGLLSKAPGVGKKTASRIILELTDKLEGFVVTKDEIVEPVVVNDELESAIDALVNLGFMRTDVEKVIKSMDCSNMDIEDIIKNSIIKLSR